MTQAAIAASTDAERRVTARPEKAAIEAPTSAAAPTRSSDARNGSARTAVRAGEDQRRDRQPGVEGIGGAATATNEPTSRQDGPDQDDHVDSDRRALEEQVGEHTDGERDGQEAARGRTIHGQGPRGTAGRRAARRRRSRLGRLRGRWCGAGVHRPVSPGGTPGGLDDVPAVRSAPVGCPVCHGGPLACAPSVHRHF